MRPDSTVQWGAYPALFFTGSLATGVVCAAAMPALSVWIWLAGCLVGLLGALVAARHGRRRLVNLSDLSTTVIAGLTLFLAGGALFTARQPPPAHPLLTAAGAEVALAGRVASPPTVGARSTRFFFAPDTLSLAEGPVVMASGRVLVSLIGPPEARPPVALGDRLRLRERLRPLSGRRNPADFDYGAYLTRRGVLATMTVEQDAEKAPVVVTTGRDRSWLEAVVTAGRAYVRGQLARHIPPGDARAVLAALLLGDRTSLDAGLRERFVQTGLMHLLAVSGLHVLLIGMTLYGLLRPLLMRLAGKRLRWATIETIRGGVVLVILGYYMLLTGAAPPVTRAVVMAAVLIGQDRWQRTTHPLNTLGVAGFILLWLNPMALFEAGFQLSFSAVAAIVTLRPVFMRPVPEAWQRQPAARFVLTSVTVSLAATLGTLPVLLFHFGRASFAGLVLNLAAIPLTAAAMGAALLMLVTGGALAGIFGAAATGLIHSLLALAEFGASVFGWMEVRGRLENGWVLAAMIVAMILVAQWPRPRYRWRLGAASLALVTVAAWLALFGPAARPHLDVLFFDVGQGDAALIRLPNGRTLLLDAGPRSAYVDHGTRTVLPHLDYAGLARLDAVLITHPHSDHLGGLPALLRAVPVGQVLHNGGSYPSALYEETRHLLDSLALPHRALHTGDTLALDPSVRLRILSPEAPPAHPDEANEGSVVLQVVFGETRLLFMGDAGIPTEARLVARYGKWLASDVVKVGHHGSATGSDPGFLAHTLPDSLASSYALISAGRNNVFGHPDGAVFDRWVATRATVWNTAEGGALWLRSDGQRLTVVPWR